MSAVTDLEIYQRLTAIAEELEQMAGRSPSLIGGTALSTACRSLIGMADAIYEHSLTLADDEGPSQ
jgi:hypothetical protein